MQPNEAGLGTHLSLDMAGNARFGPDVQYTDQIEYSVDPSRGDTFYAAIREYWPELPDRALQPSFSGIRPKVISGCQGSVKSDFEACEESFLLTGREQNYGFCVERIGAASHSAMVNSSCITTCYVESHITPSPTLPYHTKSICLANELNQQMISEIELDTCHRCESHRLADKLEQHHLNLEVELSCLLSWNRL